MSQSKLSRVKAQLFLFAPQFEQNVAVCSISPPQYWHGIITTSLVITSFWTKIEF
jgi:hypothetical protein